MDLLSYFRLNEEPVKPISQRECIFSEDSFFDQLFQAFENSWDEYLIMLGVYTSILILYFKVGYLRYIYSNY
jgi:hypothetical protein